MVLTINKATTTVLISKKAYLDLVHILSKEISDIKLISPEVSFTNDYKNVKFKFNFKTRENTELDKKVLEIKNFLNNSTNLLQGCKPHSITMNWIGSF